MRPAFSSTKSAAAFVLLLLILLLLPVLAGKNILPSRAQNYAAQSSGSGPYPYLHHEIFEEQGDIDIAFIGSSHIAHCINARRVQDALSQKLGRPATVRVFGWGGAGYDALYFISKDLLTHRRVHMLVFYDDFNNGSRNAKSPTWFRLREDASALAGLPLSEKEYFYFAALVGMPRNLLDLVRPDLSVDWRATNYWQEHYRSENLAATLGSTRSELGFDSRPKGSVDPSVPFVDFSPTNGITAANTFIYSANTKTNFDFLSQPVFDWEIHFIHLFTALAAQHKTQLVMLRIPTIDDAKFPLITERTFWPDAFGTNLVMLGVPPSRMFFGLSNDDLHKLYFNSSHLNKNGQDYFTALVSPALLQIYETASDN